MSSATELRAKFWQWFEAHGDRIFSGLLSEDDGTRDDASEKISDALENVAPGVTFVFGGKPGAEGREFVLSADGKRKYADTVKDLVSSAPELPGWRIVAFRPRMPVNSSVGIRLGGESIEAEDIWFAAEETDSGLDVTYHVRGLTPENVRLRGLGTVLLMDHALGEADSMTLVASFRHEPLSGDPAGQGLKPFTELVEVVDAFKARRYPPPGSLDLPQDAWIALEGRIAGKPAHIQIDGGLRRIAGHPSYDRRLVVAVEFHDVRQSGLPATEAEFEKVHALGEKVTETLQMGQQALLAATVLNQGKRELIFYTSDPQGSLARLEPLRAQTTSHTLQVSVRPETFWGTYRDFLDSVRQDG